MAKGERVVTFEADESWYRWGSGFAASKSLEKTGHAINMT
jgi:hypothetical protein